MDVLEFYNKYHTDHIRYDKMINIRGCNGAGKSSVPMSMIEDDPASYGVTWYRRGKERVVATVIPKYNFVVLGRYKTKCGGLDTFKSTDEIIDALEIFWSTNWNILMEGVLASTVYSTYANVFTEFQGKGPQRDIQIVSLIPSVEECLKRIQLRNGGKPIKEDLVQNKWKIVKSNAKKFRDAGFNSIEADNSSITKSQTLGWFMNLIGCKFVMRSPVKEQFKRFTLNPQDNQVTVTNELSIASDEYISQFPWKDLYVTPDSTVEINQEWMDSYWKWIHERLSIYYRRVVKRDGFPWTEDQIMREYRFTNISRDMDKLTIYEREKILSHLEDSTDDMDLLKKSVIFNIVLFRIFVKEDTYEQFGFIDFSNPNWKDQWEHGKDQLLKRRERGITNFTGSFMVNGLRSANKDSGDCQNKTLNALCMAENILKDIDNFYQDCFVECRSMKDQIEIMHRYNGIGDFNAYELACSFAMAGEYFSNPLVNWTQDSYTSAGPGAERGLRWIFNDMGNLSLLEGIVYLRSVWRIEMERLGLLDSFLEMLPSSLNGELNLRCIEHCLCETHKYNKLKTSTGRTRQRFRPETENLERLIQ